MVGHRRRRLSYISVTHRQLHELQVLRVSVYRSDHTIQFTDRQLSRTKHRTCAQGVMLKHVYLDH